MWAVKIILLFLDIYVLKSHKSDISNFTGMPHYISTEKTDAIHKVKIPHYIQEWQLVLECNGST